MKKILKKILKLFSLELRRLNVEQRFNNFKYVYKSKVKSSPVIFDIGANEGQSIERFKSMFPSATIHAFEPDVDLFSILKKKYGKDKNIVLNNLAVGNKSELKNFNVHARSETSSFLKLKRGSNWLKERAAQYDTTPDHFTTKIVEVEVVTIDQYAKKYNIDFIDILKSDTQGFDDKVIEGCKRLIENKLISFLELEIIFDDVYENYFSFSDYEKLILPSGYRMVGLKTSGSDLYSSINFFADVLYFNDITSKENEY